MSKILCIIDGMTDAEFCAEDLPNLSSMYRAQMADTTRGSEPESLGCILRLLGVKHIPAHLRGYAEALGNGIAVSSSDLVVRGSWFALDGTYHATVPVPAPENAEVGSLCRYYPLGGYKSLLVFSGLAPFVSDIVTYPPYVWAGADVRALCPSGCTALSQVFHANCTRERMLAMWGQSVSASLPPFPQRAAVICGTPIVRGIARLLSMDCIAVAGATGDTDTDLLAKAKAAVDASRTYPFVLLHLNGADEAAHRRNVAEKREFLEKVDAVVLKMLLRSGSEVHVVADHGTDPYTGAHLGGRQPLFTNSYPKAIRKKSDITEAMLAPPNLTATQRRAWAIDQLRRKAELLGRVPKKADFSDVECIRIKAILGPWSRALEAAELKPPREKK